MGVPPMSLCPTSQNGAFNDCGGIGNYALPSKAVVLEYGGGMFEIV
jgi:hypothetical protein